MSNHIMRRTRALALPLVLRAAVVALGVLLTTGVVMEGSRAAFTGSTANTGSSVTAGTVTLADDDSGSVLFNVAGMVPGASTQACIVVTYSGTIADPIGVKLYSAGYSDSDDLANWLNVTIEEGTGGSFGDCSGFSVTATIESGGDLVTFAADHASYATGAGTWDPAGSPESKTYRITLALDAATPDSQQGDSVTALGFTWEVRSN